MWHKNTLREIAKATQQQQRTPPRTAHFLYTLMMLLLILLVYLSHGHIKGVVVYIYTRPGNIKPACVHCTPLSHFPTNPETTKSFHFPGPFLRLFPENILNIQDLSSWDSISIPLPGHHWSCSISKP